MAKDKSFMFNILFILLLVLQRAKCLQRNNTVYVIVMLPHHDPLGRASFAANYDDGHDVTPAAFLATNQINNRSDLLQNYTLKLILSDGGCSISSRAVVSYAKDFSSQLW